MNFQLDVQVDIVTIFTILSQTENFSNKYNDTFSWLVEIFIQALKYTQKSLTMLMG